MQNEEKNLQENNENSKESNQELEALKNELANLKDSYRHLAADFDNYKKRISREQARYSLSAQSEILLDLLPIVDNFDRAFKKSLVEQTPEVKAWLSGFEIINNEIKKFLKSSGVEEVQMKTFDPEIHEAISQIEVPGKNSGEIIDYVEKGYTFKGQLLRPAKVAVTK